jgi:diguanylate cyclase (GGDEF)-like protein/PAS domain S-box-containing protein
VKQLTIDQNFIRKASPVWFDQSLKHGPWISLACCVVAILFVLTAPMATPGLFPFLLTGLTIPAIYCICARYYRDQMSREVSEDFDAAAGFSRPSHRNLGPENLYRSAFDNAAGLALVSPNGRWLTVNRALCEMLGYSDAELLSSSISDVSHPDDVGTVLVNIDKLLTGTISSYQVELRYLHKLGHPVWVLLSISLVRSYETHPSHLVFQVQNITERKQAEERLVHDVFHDALTGLPNRTLFMDRLNQAVERSRRRKGRVFAVLFLDLDRFKSINDTLGHMVGDQLLIEVARRMKTALRSTDTISRLGGDEFTILLEDLNDQDESVRIVERLQKELSQGFHLGNHDVLITASIGLALSTDGYESADEILRDADRAMYRAKASGKSRYELFDKTAQPVPASSQSLETDLALAIERRELTLHYQPIVCLRTGRLLAFEALARWQHPQSGLISPINFIPMAEETGFIGTLGKWVIREACRQLRYWHDRYPLHSGVSMCVNLSNKQFMQPDLIDQILGALQETRLAPGMLKLEITESGVMENIGAATVMLQQLRALGVEVAIDDFGTGYSSLSYLHRLPVNTLKIDRSFVTRMLENEDNAEIIKTIVTLARSLDMSIVAEGVETVEQAAQLRLLKCDAGQGYLFSKPTDADSAEVLLGTQVQWQATVASLDGKPRLAHTRQRGQFAMNSPSSRSALLRAV